MSGSTRLNAGLGVAVMSITVAVTSVVLLAAPNATAVASGDGEAHIAALEERIQALERQVDEMRDAVDHNALPSADAQGAGAAPSRLKAPVEVFDESGQVILRIQRGPAGGGVLEALDTSGAAAATIGVGRSTGTAGVLRVWNGRTEVVRLGSATQGQGVMLLSDEKGQARILASADTLNGGVALYDGASAERVRLGWSDGTRGYVAVRNEKGLEVAQVFESAAGVGNLVTRDGEGQGVQIGTKSRESGSFGDVCATSPKGGMCLSALAIKAMSPY